MIKKAGKKAFFFFNDSLDSVEANAKERKACCLPTPATMSSTAEVKH